MMQSKIHLALGASLVLNTLLIGFLIGKVTSNHRPRWAPPPLFFEAMHPPRQGASTMVHSLQQALRESEAGLAGLREQVIESRQTLGKVLEEERIDQDQLNTATSEHIALTNRFTAASQGALVKAIARLPLEERRHLLKRLTKDHGQPMRRETTHLRDPRGGQ